MLCAEKLYRSTIWTKKFMRFFIRDFAQKMIGFYKKALIGTVLKSWSAGCIPNCQSELGSHTFLQLLVIKEEQIFLKLRMKCPTKHFVGLSVSGLQSIALGPEFPQVAGMVNCVLTLKQSFLSKLKNYFSSISSFLKMFFKASSQIASIHGYFIYSVQADPAKEPKWSESYV